MTSGKSKIAGGISFFVKVVHQTGILEFATGILAEMKGISVFATGIHGEMKGICKKSRSVCAYASVMCATYPSILA